MALAVKNPPANSGDITDVGLIRGWGRSPKEGNDNPLQYSCLEKPMDRGTWWATVHGGQKELDTTERLSTCAGYMTEVDLYPTASEFMPVPSLKFEQFGIFHFPFSFICIKDFQYKFDYIREVLSTYRK